MKFEINHINDQQVEISCTSLFTEHDVEDLKKIVGDLFANGKIYMKLDLSNTSQPEFEFKETGPFGIEITMLASYKDWTLFKCQSICRILLQNGKSIIHLNLTNIPFVESFGIGILMGLREIIEAEGGTLELSLHPQLNNLFQKINLHQVFSIIN